MASQVFVLFFRQLKAKTFWETLNISLIKFLLFLDWNDALFIDGEKRISDALLAALILMIEKSRDEDKEMIIRTALNCIC